MQEPSTVDPKAPWRDALEVMLATVRSNPGGANTARYYENILRPIVERHDPATLTSLDVERIVRASRKDGRPRAGRSG